MPIEYMVAFLRILAVVLVVMVIWPRLLRPWRWPWASRDGTDPGQESHARNKNNG